MVARALWAVLMLMLALAVCMAAPLGSSVTLSATSAAAQEATRDITVEGMRSEKRIALVIGNARYAASPLRNPVNDAREMAQVLRIHGFAVTIRENAGQKEMQKAIIDFGARLKEGGVGLFYYSGHGVQMDGRNYMVPVNATITSEPEVEVESVDVAYVLARMGGAQNRLNIVILDACRDNPFARSFKSATRGLATIDAPAGTIIAYATAPGKVARDGEGPNGLYTAELLRTIRLPGLKIEDVFKRVRQAVQTKTKGSQVPWESSSLTGDFMFSLPAKGPSIAALAPLAPSLSPPSPAPPATGIAKTDRLDSGEPGRVGPQAAATSPNTAVKQNGREQQILELLREAGRVQSAIAHDVSQARALVNIATLQARLGADQESSRSVQEALQRVSSIKDTFAKAHALHWVARAQAQSGDLLGALRVAGTIPDNRFKDTAFLEIALDRAKANDRAGSKSAIEAWAKIVGNRDTGEIARSLARIGEAYARLGLPAGATGSFAEALRAAHNTPVDPRRATNTTSKISASPDTRASALLFVANAQIRASDRTGAAKTLLEALQSARYMNEASSKAYALNDIAEAQAKAGYRTEAAQAIGEALEVAASVQEVSLKGSVLASIARVLAESGEIRRALTVIASIPDPEWRSSAVEYVARAQANSGDVKGALRTVAGAQGDRSSVFADIAKAQASVGNVHEAWRTVGTINDEGSRANAAHEAARASARAGDFTRIRSDDSPTVKTYALIGAAMGGMERLKGSGGELLW